MGSACKYFEIIVTVDIGKDNAYTPITVCKNYGLSIQLKCCKCKRIKENPTHFKEVDGEGLFESHLAISSQRRRRGWIVRRCRTRTEDPRLES